MAPGEVRTCCKRFFVEGELRGDVVLHGIDIRPNEGLDFAQVEAAKRRLHRRINLGEASACDGCPFLKFAEWGDISPLKISYLSMEQHSVCNLRCSYCDDTYFGGLEAAYSVDQTLAGMVARRGLAEDSIVVWGGGEPTLAKNFEHLVVTVDESAPEAHHRFLTNARLYSPVIDELLQAGRATVFTSLDAGTAATFKRVRGRSGMNQVLTTLNRYATSDSRSVVVKYIFTEGNRTVSEVSNFVAACVEAQLGDCNFQISYDFKDEAVSEDGAGLIFLMYSLLYSQVRGLVILDDLLHLRIGSLLDPGNQFSANLAMLWADADFLQSEPFSAGLVLWGAGERTRTLLGRPGFVERWNVVGVCDSRKSVIGTSFADFEVLDPLQVAQGNTQVFLSGVQAVPVMLREADSLGLTRDRVVRRLLW